MTISMETQLMTVDTRVDITMIMVILTVDMADIMTMTMTIMRYYLPLPHHTPAHLPRLPWSPASS